MRVITATPLSAEAFAPFGTVTQIPHATGLVSVDQAYDATSDAQIPVFQLMRTVTGPQPVAVRQLEQHPFSAQTFVTLSGASSVIIVCETGPSGPEEATARAFVCAPTQAVTYAKAVWHHRLTPLGDNAVFSMTMMHTGTGGDTVLQDLVEPFEVALP
ncbi:putative ureidoglycolate lyase [Brucella endophytica]|uniref:Ureidoglycolate lyase n=1 Tax=Brucella endophytica TaxID=1963359 RepID=A0A916SN26_9HYPH|nr:ureidoglycolate lyase [Brucella endophytica]GGB04504.1 putative ureidoglycolate lyase [Brucella endophytica]